MLRTAKKYCEKALSPLARRIEQCIVMRQPQPPWPPIFIIGPARSGTTLVYQCVTQGFELSYMANFMAERPWYPCLVAKLARLWGVPKPQGGFSSSYGRIEGRWAPSQAFEMWSRWFPKEDEGIAGISLTDAARRQLAGTVSCVERTFNAPFVNKWPGFSVNVRALCEAIPDAVFVSVHRDLLQTAQSLLRGRIEVHNDPHYSTSRAPSSYSEFAGKSYAEQVAAYVLGVEEDINRDKTRIGGERFLDISYEELCRDPQGFCSRFQRWYHELTGYAISATGHVPEKFTCSYSQKVSPADLAALKDSLRRLAQTRFRNIGIVLAQAGLLQMAE